MAARQPQKKYHEQDAFFVVMQATQDEKITAQMAFFFLVSFVQRVL